MNENPTGAMTRISVALHERDLALIESRPAANVYVYTREARHMGFKKLDL